jgi:hypothetical protein
MKILDERRFPSVVLFVIVLITITVFSWKSCSDNLTESRTNFNRKPLLSIIAN